MDDSDSSTEVQKNEFIDLSNRGNTLARFLLLLIGLSLAGWASGGFEAAITPGGCALVIGFAIGAAERAYFR